MLALTALRTSLGLAGRNLLLVRRVPSVFIPSLVMPLFILISTSGAFRGIGALPDFAGASYLAFTLPMAATMGAGFAGVNSGMTLARDLEGGFFDRLQASPVPRIALLRGPLLAAVARSLFTTTVVYIAAMHRGRAAFPARSTRSSSTSSRRRSRPSPRSGRSASPCAPGASRPHR